MDDDGDIKAGHKLTFSKVWTNIGSGFSNSKTFQVVLGQAKHFELFVLDQWSNHMLGK